MNAPLSWHWSRSLASDAVLCTHGSGERGPIFLSRGRADDPDSGREIGAQPQVPGPLQTQALHLPVFEFLKEHERAFDRRVKRMLCAIGFQVYLNLDGPWKHEGLIAGAEPTVRIHAA